MSNDALIRRFAVALVTAILAITLSSFIPDPLIRVITGGIIGAIAAVIWAGVERNWW